MDAVGDLLAQRRIDRFPIAPAIGLALLLHAGVLGALILSAIARPMRYAPPRAVAVRLISAGSIRAPAPVQAEEPAPPAAAPKPKIEKPAPVEEIPKPSKNAVLLPAKEDKKKPTPPPVSRPGKTSAPAVSLPSSGEEAVGSTNAGPPGPAGAGGVGSVRFDQPDFKYPVYVERMAQIISMHWFKPAQSVQTIPVVRFRIERDGTIVDPQIVTSSGLPFVDRAALRAVIDSSPLPPLPAEYGKPEVGVQVVFE